jgi:xylulokinase
VTAAPPVYLGVDLGTSALKVVALGEDGRVHGVARRGYPTTRPEPGAAEQDPRDWFAALRDALDDLAASAPPRTWAALGLTGMLPTLVELDAVGRPLCPAITWEDGRAEPDADVLRSRYGDESLYRTTGQRYDGRYLAAMHSRMDRLGQAGATVAGAKDALFAELTGELLTDPSTAAGFGVYDLDAGRWDAELVASSGIPALPEVATADTAVTMRAEWRDRWRLPADLPVVLGGADSVIGAIGLGARDHGDVGVVAGTSAIVLGISDHPSRDPGRRYLVTPLATPEWGLEMDVLSVGSAFSAIAGLLGLAGPAALLDAAATVAPEDAPVFLPYLTPGEQGALWDPDLTGTLHGLRLDTGVGHIGRALLNGVVVELRRCVAILECATNRRGPLLLGGAAAVSPLLRQDLADATERDVVVDAAVTDHSSVGAASFAAAALGVPVSISTAHTRVAPRPGLEQTWSELAERHDALRRRLTRTESS